ncbi:MAG: Spy/CpxP family protein refolding chaperone [Candidatus Desantisbacteria bacterium]
MRRMMQSLIIAAVGVMIVVPTISAQPHEGMDGLAIGHPEQAADKIFKELNLTEEQKNKLKQNRKAQQEAMKGLRTQMMKKHAELRDTLSKPDVSRAIVEPIAAELKALQAKIMDCRLDGIFAVKEILTPEQYAKFQEKVKEKVENRKEQRGQWKKHRGQK